MEAEKRTWKNSLNTSILDITWENYGVIMNENF